MNQHQNSYSFESPVDNQLVDSIIGCILGTAIGDSVGLCYEGLFKDRQQKLYPGEIRQRLFFGKGMVSDDTEHTCMVAQALLLSKGEAKAFAKSMARQMRLWFLTIPSGAGMATLRACLRLCCGISPERSGVFSAGNGPAMRSALIGVCYGSDQGRTQELVHISTILSHTDPKAEYGALAVAVAAYHASVGLQNPKEYLERIQTIMSEDASDLLELVATAVRSAESGQDTVSFAESLGLSNGVSGYIYHTVPVALHAWFRYPTEYRSAISAIIRCGGDTDTIAAITGAIIGAGVGKKGIPSDWLKNLHEWPRSVQWMESLGHKIAMSISKSGKEYPMPLSVPAIYLRNLIFLIIILCHGFRRLLPPY